MLFEVALCVCFGLSEIGSTISNLFGGGSKSADTGDVRPEGSSEEATTEVQCAVVTLQPMSDADNVAAACVD